MEFKTFQYRFIWIMFSRVQLLVGTELLTKPRNLPNMLCGGIRLSPLKINQSRFTCCASVDRHCQHTKPKAALDYAVWEYKAVVHIINGAQCRYMSNDPAVCADMPSCLNLWSCKPSFKNMPRSFHRQPHYSTKPFTEVIMWLSYA